MKLALPASPVVPVTAIAYEPFVPDATMNEPAIAPPATVQIGLVISPLGDDEIVQLVSPAAKLDPETRTLVPGRPDEGATDTAGVTVKAAVPLSFAWFPLTLTVTGPGAPVGTLNEPVAAPADTVQLHVDGVVGPK